MTKTMELLSAGRTSSRRPTVSSSAMDSGVTCVAGRVQSLRAAEQPPVPVTSAHGEHQSCFPMATMASDAGAAEVRQDDCPTPGSGDLARLHKRSTAGRGVPECIRNCSRLHLARYGRFKV